MNTEQTTLAIVELKNSKKREAYYRERAGASRDTTVQDFYYRKLAEQEMFTKAIETIMEIYEA